MNAVARGVIAIALGSVALLPAEVALAQDLGRLFFTPEQRAALDARRKARVPDKPAAAPVTESPLTRVDGAVRRQGGKSTVWVNGEAIGETPQGPKPAQQGPRVSVPVPVGEGEQRYDLRVGETLDRGSGEVRDVIGEGEIKIRPGRAAPKK